MRKNEKLHRSIGIMLDGLAWDESSSNSTSNESSLDSSPDDLILDSRDNTSSSELVLTPGGNPWSLKTYQTQMNDWKADDWSLRGGFGWNLNEWKRSELEIPLFIGKIWGTVNNTPASQSGSATCCEENNNKLINYLLRHDHPINFSLHFIRKGGMITEWGQLMGNILLFSFSYMQSSNMCES